MTAVATWPGRAETWLDERGKGAWIAAMVLGFIVFWPIGLALLAYMIWGKQMFGKSCKSNACRATAYGNFRSSGNSAFDAYKAETLKRLEDEQEAFPTSWTGCARPRTRPNSTPSWTTAPASAPKTAPRPPVAGAFSVQAKGATFSAGVFATASASRRSMLR
jgi:hypothetical protein